MFQLNLPAAVQIGDRARYLQNSVIGASGKAQPVEQLAKQRIRIWGKRAESGEHRGRDFRIAGDAQPTEPAVLYPSGVGDTRPDLCGGFLLPSARKQVISDRQDLDMQVDPVEQRPGNPIQIPLDSGFRSGTTAGRVSEISTGAGIHRRNQCKPAGIAEPGLCSRKGECPILKRLAERFQHRTLEFRQFVKE